MEKPISTLENSISNNTDRSNAGSNKWVEVEHALAQKGKEVKNLSLDYINESPFKSVLVASAAGLVIGYLFSKFRN